MVPRVSMSVIAVIGLLLLLAVRGFSHFWPSDILEAKVVYQGTERMVLGEIKQNEQVGKEQLESAGIELQGPGPFFDRSLMKQGNRDFLGVDFVWLLDEQLQNKNYPANAMAVERSGMGQLLWQVGQCLSQW